MQLATMMDVPLTIDLVVDRAERWTSGTEVVSRRPDKSISRTTYGQVAARARRLARALVGAGVKRGDRVATCPYVVLLMLLSGRRDTTSIQLVHRSARSTTRSIVSGTSIIVACSMAAEPTGE